MKKLAALRHSGLSPFGGAAERASIAVSFDTKVNHVGVQQAACTLCGDCVTGCNYAAKNTLIMNYLPDAVNHGAEVYCGVGVRSIESRDSKQRKRLIWLVHFQLLDADRQRFQGPL